MINICIADDHILIREGLKNILKEAQGINVVGETEDPFDIIDMVSKTNCDILILDLSMPGKNGIEVLKDIKAVRPEVKVLILSMYPEDQFARRTFKAGASGYLTKESASEEILQAIQKIDSGGRYVTPSLAELLAEDLDEKTGKTEIDKLSDREFQVFLSLAKGKPLSEIADNLALSVSTINTYRSRILEKLNLESTSDLIRFAVKNNLID